MNDGLGYFGLIDSVYFEYGYAPVFGEQVDNNNYVDIIGRHQNSNPHKENVAIIYNYGLSGFDSIKIFNLYNNYVVIDDYASGDNDNDGDNDIVFTCNNDYFWGIIYNDGTGNFSAPEYFDLAFPPIDIACADLNDDGRADVVISGSDTDIYFSTETGFQQLVLTTTLSHDVLISDFDNDGDNDIITHTTYVYPNHRVYMFENLGNNQFFEHDYFQFSPFCQDGQIADFNNDSLPDMIFSAHDNTGLHIYHNKGDFQLEFDQFIPISCTQCLLRDVASADLDGNGFNDIVTIRSTNYYSNNNLIILYNNNGVFQENPVTGLVHQEKEISIACYPNPFINKINFDFTKINFNRIVLSIYDIQGKKVFDLTTNNKKGGNNLISWNACDFSDNQVKPGTYFALVKIDEEYYKTIKLIKH